MKLIYLLTLLLIACNPEQTKVVSDILKDMQEEVPMEEPQDVVIYQNLNNSTGLNSYDQNGEKVCEISPGKKDFELLESIGDFHKVTFDIDLGNCPKIIYVKKSKYFKVKSVVVPAPSKDWKAEYNDTVRGSLTTSMLNIQDADYWIRVFRAMSKAESGHKPKTEYKENFKNSKGEYIISTGLLQISLGSTKAYGCPFKVQEDLYDPIENLKCGVRMMDKLTKKDKIIWGKKNGKWTGGSRYWAVLRNDGRSAHARFLKEFNKK